MGLLSAGTAAALQSDSDQPINITSATQEADLNNNIAIFTGDVVIIQGSIEIHADRVEVYKAVPEKKQTTTSSPTASPRPSIRSRTTASRLTLLGRSSPTMSTRSSSTSPETAR